ncbi:MAG TPA: DUF2111 domain-containing protein [Candidatus Methanofastidiosa archaeon]|nr:DUF2111 domain-containing protein [Candidatus Methanofastidiosa archaeon]
MIKITKDSKACEICKIALAIHQLCGGLPVTMRSLEEKGVRVERGKVVDMSYTGPILEEVLEKGIPIRAIPKKGKYKGLPIRAVPILNEDQEVVAAIGVIDITLGIFDDLIQITSRPELRKLRDLNML